MQILNSQSSLSTSLPTSLETSQHAAVTSRSDHLRQSQEPGSLVSTLVDHSHPGAHVTSHSNSHNRAMLHTHEPLTRPEVASQPQPHVPTAHDRIPTTNVARAPLQNSDVTAQPSLQLSPTAIVRFLTELGLNASQQQQQQQHPTTSDVTTMSAQSPFTVQKGKLQQVLEGGGGNASFNSGTSERSVHFASPVQVKNYTPESPLSHPQPHPGNVSPPTRGSTNSSWGLSRLRANRKDIASLDWQFHFRRLPALVRGYLVRRLYRTEKVQTIIKTISVSFD